MRTTITFKQTDSDEAIRAYINEKLLRLDRRLYQPGVATVVLSIEKHRHTIEITVSGDRMTFIGSDTADDFRTAIDRVMDKLDAQLKREKDTRRSYRQPMGRDMDRTTDIHHPDTTPQVHVQTIKTKPMDVEEAVLQMDLVNDMFLVFTNSKNQRVNVLYRRADGDFGLIQPTP